MHPSQRQPHITPIESPLYVVIAVENPAMYASRYANYHVVAKHVEDSGAILYTVELAIGNRQFEVTEAGNPRHIQLRAQTEIWRKENLQNIGVAHLPHDWQYVCLADADMVNTRPDWAQATVQALQQYDAIQGFATYSFLRSDYSVESVNDGWVYGLSKVPTSERTPGRHYGAPGGQWAFRRSAWDKLGGLLQTPILGSADRYMSYGFAGLDDSRTDEEFKLYAPGYVQSIRDWQERAKALNGNIWHLDNHAIHYWHGPYQARGYEWRWKILATHAFDPATDLTQQLSGLLELRGNKPAMRDEIRAYNRSRNEDQKSISAPAVSAAIAATGPSIIE
jgi:hypothetical protein